MKKKSAYTHLIMRFILKTGNQRAHAVRHLRGERSHTSGGSKQYQVGGQGAATTYCPLQIDVEENNR